jgi:hypothetical protein
MAAMSSEVDLRDNLMKALYEMGVAELPGSPV